MKKLLAILVLSLLFFSNANAMPKWIGKAIKVCRANQDIDLSMVWYYDDGSVEEQIDFSLKKGDNVTLYKNSKINTCIASGSFHTDGMVIVPASMGTVGRIASGVSTTMVERAADVILKEKRKLIIVPRETPFSTIHLKNLLTLDQAGAHILPASPGFYSGQKTFEDLVDFVVARILDQLNIEQGLMDPYQG